MRGPGAGHALDHELRVLRHVHLDAPIDAEALRPLVGAVHLGEGRLQRGAVAAQQRAPDLVGRFGVHERSSIATCGSRLGDCPARTARVGSGEVGRIAGSPRVRAHARIAGDVGRH